MVTGFDIQTRPTDIGKLQRIKIAAAAAIIITQSKDVGKHFVPGLGGDRKVDETRPRDFGLLNQASIIRPLIHDDLCDVPWPSFLGGRQGQRYVGGIVTVLRVIGDFDDIVRQRARGQRALFEALLNGCPQNIVQSFFHGRILHLTLTAKANNHCFMVTTQVDRLKAEDY